MSRDVYQPCPFCTDRKIKFCCADIADEMLRITRQIDGGQQRTALKRLEKLAETYPETVWNEMTRVMVLMGDERGPEAIPILERLHAAYPDNIQVASIYAGVSLNERGYMASREVIWRVLRKAHGPSPMLGSLLAELAEGLVGQRYYLAARQYLMVAMRLASENDRREIFDGLMEFDGDQSIPYPFRGVHSLRPVAGLSDPQGETAHKASRLAERGCFGPAADRFAAVAEQLPDNAAVAYNTGLCRAWAGDHSEAAAAFLRAARAESEFELAAEYAVLGQLLSSMESDEAMDSRTIIFAVDSIDDVVQAIDQLPTATRRKIPLEHYGPDRIVNVIDLAEGPVPDSSDSLAVDDCPRRLGTCILDGGGEEDIPPSLMLVCDDADRFESCIKLLAEVMETGEEVRQADRTHRTSRVLPAGFEEFVVRRVYPPDLSTATRQRFDKDEVFRQIERWLRTPQSLLDGQTIEEAAEKPPWHVEVSGLIHLLDVSVFHQLMDVDVEQYRERLGLPRSESATLDEDHSLFSFSTMQMHRVRIEELDDRQLGIVLNRSLLICHWPFLRRVLLASLDRDLPGFPPERICDELANLARKRGDTQDALHWIEEGRREARSREIDEDPQTVFIDLAKWDFRELSVRVDQGDSPELQDYLRGLASYYGRKLPQFVEYIEQFVRQSGIAMPRIHSAEEENRAEKTLWTPDQPGASGQKLWLPGS